MKLFKKLDNYLLHYYPNIWITRIHQFLPIGLLIIALIFIVNVFVVGFDLRDDLYFRGDIIFVLFIPVLAYLIYWFVIQSRYNVEKSGGKLSILYEYMNFGLYYLIFLVAFSILYIVPVSNEYKIYKSINESQLNEDIYNLNLGNVIVNDSESLTVNGDTYTFTPEDYAYSWEKDFYYDNEVINKEIKVNKEELIEIVNNYIKSYNRYSYDLITASPLEIIKNNKNNENYYDDNLYRYDNVGYKLRRLLDIKEEGWSNDLFHPLAVKIILGFIAIFALLIWVFKQVHWKNYLFGLAAILFTPLIFGILGLIVFGILTLNPAENEVSFFIILLYLIVAGKVAMSYSSKTKSNLGVVLAMYLQCFLPALPFFVWFAFFYNPNKHTSDETLLNLIYIWSWILGLLSIFIFKRVYRKISLMPAKK